MSADRFSFFNLLTLKVVSRSDLLAQECMLSQLHMGSTCLTLGVGIGTSGVERRTHMHLATTLHIHSRKRKSHLDGRAAARGVLSSRNTGHSPSRWFSANLPLSALACHFAPEGESFSNTIMKSSIVTAIARLFLHIDVIYRIQASYWW